jgi:uncharacterized membrane protein YkvA (DUF1232 family)
VHVTAETASPTTLARAGAFLQRVTRSVRDRQVHRLIDSRQLVFNRLREIPKRMQILTNQVRLLLDLVEDYTSGEYRRVPWYSVAVAVAAALYFMSPSDFIPDYLPAIGHVDDLLLLGIAIRLLKKDLIAYAEHKGLDPNDYFSRGSGSPPAPAGSGNGASRSEA